MRSLIKVENLCKSFGKLEVLKNISQSIFEGEVISIIGPSGSGKSTVFKMFKSFGEALQRECVF